MKRNTDQPPPQPQCALNPPQPQQQPNAGSSSSNSPYGIPRDDRNSAAGRNTPGRNSFQQYPPAQQPKRENQPSRMSQSWPANNYNNASNNPWEGDWSGNTPPVKNETDPGDYYKQTHPPARTHPPPAYPSTGGEWPPGPSTTSGGAGYGVMSSATNNSAGGTTYSENNGYSTYNSGYSNYGQLPYTQTNYNNPQPSSYQQPSQRMADGYQHHQQPKQHYHSPSHHHNQQPQQQHHQPHNQQQPYHHHQQQPKQHYPQSQYHHQPQYHHHQRSQQQHHPHQQQHYQQQHHQQMVNNNSGGRVPSACPPGVVKQEGDRCGQVPDYSSHHMQRQYGMGGVPRVEIKQEPPDDYQPAENENFSSIFSHSLSSLYLESGEDPDIMVLESPCLEQPTTPIVPPQELTSAPVDNNVTYQRLHSSGGHLVCNPSMDLRNSPVNNYGYYGNGVTSDSQEPQGTVMQEIGAPGASNSFRYDRPSFDDMHLYGPNASSDTKSQAKKRKTNGPPAPSEGAPERGKKPRMIPLSSESQWTPNSFGFNDATQVKQEPMDDYSPMETETPLGPPQDSSSPTSSGTGSNSKPERDHPAEITRQPPKKRSPTTCFEKYEKKTEGEKKKKVSPISIYAKVQDNMVISVKCRRYKKRTKVNERTTECEPSTCRMEAAMEAETYREVMNLSPYEVSKAVMNDILDRVTLITEMYELGSLDISELSPLRIQELFIAFCHQSNLDYTDFEDIQVILRPRIVFATEAKNSERASAIPRRIPPVEPQPSTSGWQPQPSTSGWRPQPSTSGVQQQPSTNGMQEMKTKRRTRTNNARTRAYDPDNSTAEPVEPRVLRRLPGRQARNNASGSSPFVLFSSRRECVNTIDLTVDNEEEEQAGKEAEVRKKSQPSKGKQPAKKVKVRDRSIGKDDKESPVDKPSRGKQPARKKSLVVEVSVEKNEEPPAARSRSRDKSKKPAKESGIDIDVCSNGGLAGVKIKQEPMDSLAGVKIKQEPEDSYPSPSSELETPALPLEQPKDLEPKVQNEVSLMKQSSQEGNKELVVVPKEIDSCGNVGVAVTHIKQEPIDDYPSTESEAIVSHQESSLGSSGMESSLPLDQPTIDQKESLKETNGSLEEVIVTPGARSRSRSKGKLSDRTKQLDKEKSLDKTNSDNGVLPEFYIKSEPISDNESNELENIPTTTSLLQSRPLENNETDNGRIPELPKMAQDKQETVKDHSLKEAKDSNSKEEVEEPVARSRSRNKRRQPVRNKHIDKDTISLAGPEGLKIKKELMDDYESTEVPDKDTSLEQLKNGSKKTSRKRGRQAKSREQSLDNAGSYEGLRRSTRFRSKKSEVPEVNYQPIKRKRLRSMFSSDSLEIVDITRSSGSASPPLLDAIEPSPSKSASWTKSKSSQTKAKSSAKGGKGKIKKDIEDYSSLKKSSKGKTKKDIDEDKPPVLRKISRKRTVNSKYIDDDIYVSPSGPRSRSRSNSNKNEPPTLPVAVEKVKIKQEPVSPKSDQKTKFGQFNGVTENKAVGHNPSLSDSQKELKNKDLDTPKTATVKSGSSKRKQGGPTKFQKDKFKNVGFPPFFEPSSVPKTSSSNTNSSVSEKCSNQNLLSNTSPPKVFNTVPSALIPETANTSETLKERYRKSFCTEQLPRTSAVNPKGQDETKQKLATFLSRNPTKKPKESIAKPKPEPKTSLKKDKRENRLSTSLNFNDLKVKQEPLSEDDIPLSQLAAESTSTSSLRTKPQKKTAQCVAVKKQGRRRSSQSSNSEPQVVITKLPDVQVDFENRTVASELVKKCEMEHERRNAEAGNPEHSETDSDEDKPLFLLQKKHEPQKFLSRKIKEEKPDKPYISKRSFAEATLPESKKKKKANDSDSEDSDCKLVIDLERRASVEEQIPSFRLQRSLTTEGTNDTIPQESSIASAKHTQDQPSILSNPPPCSFTENTSSSKDISIEPPLQQPSETTKPDNSSLFRDATEEAHILLELSRSGFPPLDIAGPSTSNWSPAVLEETGKEQEKDESILRTLLLENGEPSTVQEVGPSSSLDPKSVPTQESMKKVPKDIPDRPTFSEMDKKQLREEIQLTPDQLSVEIETNPHFIPANYEWCLTNTKSTREVVQKLRDQIQYLQRKSERKNVSDLNLKKISKLRNYKEEILKRLLRRANLEDPSEPKTKTTTALCSQQPAPPSYAATSQLSSALLGNTVIKPKIPSATVTSGDCYPGENLPTVATMVAKANENYGVDLRTVTSRGPAKTILQEALSSKDPIYRPVAIRSPLPQLERSSDSFLGFPVSPLATAESTFSPHRTSSPQLPELSRASQLSRRLQGSSSPFPPTLQPELRPGSSFTPVVQGSFARSPFGAVSETEAARTSHSSSPPVRVPSSNYPPGPIPQGSSMWGRPETERSAVINPPLNNGASNPRRKRSTDRRTKTSKRSAVSDQRAGIPTPDRRTDSMSSSMAHAGRLTPFEPRGVSSTSSGLPSSSQSRSFDPRGYLSTIGSHHASSRRSAPFDHRSYQGASNQQSSVDLRTNPMSYTSLNSGEMTNAGSSFMIVPPPTTLQSAFSESIRRSMLEGYRPTEMLADRPVERIQEQRTEGTNPHFVPRAGPLIPKDSSSGHPMCAGCGVVKGRYICSICKVTYYCSTDCQNLHWQAHSKACSSKSNS